MIMSFIMRERRRDLRAWLSQQAIVGKLVVEELPSIDVQDEIAGRDMAPRDLNKEEFVVEPMCRKGVAVIGEGRLQHLLAVGSVSYIQGRLLRLRDAHIVGIDLHEPPCSLWEGMRFAEVGTLAMLTPRTICIFLSFSGRSGP
jgi:hypothetical protein